MRALQPPFFKAAVGVVRSGRGEVATMRLAVRQSLCFGAAFSALAVALVLFNISRPPRDAISWIIVGGQIFIAMMHWAKSFLLRRILVKRLAS
ncbi:MAG: hypothetical protein IAI50_09410 [Candidatus Eremiobacteraeota bacterium]|nr:hypothetical protein [Candidatus Eremiobacteraeota bacterium]